MRKLTKEQKQEIMAIAEKKDDEIDFSDIPPVLDWSGAEIGKFYRPPKKVVTMRLDADVIEWLKVDGPGYQTKANWLLRHAMIQAKQKNDLVSKKRVARQSSRASRQKKRRDLVGSQTPPTNRTDCDPE
jgi:uncharacterized protein (DUF4415 family)